MDTPQVIITPPAPMPAVIARALVTIQKDLETMAKTEENGAYGSKFVPLPEVMTFALGVLTSYGIGVTQAPVTDAHGHAALETTLVHEDGESYSRTTKLALIGKSITPQGHASAITYMRRYALTAMLGITSEEDDDDGNTASAKEMPPTEAQKIELKSMLVQLKFPSEAIAQEIWKARTRDQAALMIVNYRKLISQKVRDIEGATEATKIEVANPSEDGPIVDESSPLATLKARLKALGLTKDGENKFVVNATDKPMFKIAKDQKMEDFRALDNALKGVESGVRHLPADWVAPTKENVIVDAEISEPQAN